jgi:hypothetical protein
VVEAAAYVVATLVAVTRQGGGAALPETTIVLEEPVDGDPGGAFASFVGGLAAAIDAGAAPADAFRDLGAALGVVPVAET